MFETGYRADGAMWSGLTFAPAEGEVVEPAILRADHLLAPTVPLLMTARAATP